ncbi:MAG: hypothetical protein ABS75_10550 [Pelagibacterium sp. SCN 63-23]|nr:MAG: hypothetical protein ABS75_10550 [Pelagibacterium sp. SCN 63-23]
MKRTVFVAALLGATVLGAPASYANSWWNADWWDNFMNSCTTLCDDDRVDIRQQLYGLQEAINNIVDIDDATDIVQTAVNAGNLVDLDVDSIVLGTVDQKANVGQYAHNLVDGDMFSTFKNLEQAATNVVNSVTGSTAYNIKQSVTNSQVALNDMFGGKGGYDVDLEGELEDAMTQTAVNAANLIDIGTLKNEISQYSGNAQTAINTAAFEGFSYYWYNHAPDVWDLGQSATNVTNNVSVGEIDLRAACACGYEIDQYANADQLAKNVLSTMGDVNNIIQQATNVANSVSLPAAPAAP